MAARRRIELILAWVEEHPEVVANIENKLASLSGKYLAVWKQLQKVIPTEERWRKILTGTVTATEKEKDAIKRVHRVVGEMGAALRGVMGKQKRTREEIGKSRSRLEGFAAKLQRAGWRLGWFAYRTMMMGRILLRWMLMPVQKAMRLLTDWESTVDRAAVAMGMMAAAGILSGEEVEWFKETIKKIIDAGMKAAGVFGLLGTVFASMAADAIQPFLPYIEDLAWTLRDVWEVVKATLIPALEELAKSIFPPLIELIKEIGPVLITSFVDGLEVALPLILQALEALKPWLPTISKLIGFLLPFAPLIMAAGMAMYFIAPLLSALNPLLLLFGTFVLAILTHWKDLTAFWNRTVGPSLDHLREAIESVIGPIDWVKLAMEAWKGAAAGLCAPIKILMFLLSGLIHIIADVIEFVRDAANFFGGLGETISNVFKLGSPSIIAELAEDVRELSTGLRGLGGIGLGGLGGMGMAGPQYITIYPSISIGEISGEIDLSKVQDAVNRGIAEALRRRLA